ncbi:class I SAM-dependent methyltransferase [Ruegeria atlantica]|uniref:Methyltransferase domain protein n=1 Tax=Ruegeria atlantica TaxID=81569 RepID=A0A0N7LR51_9RHOB|nr:class I SAM-dependent methyltransferase [Ruegeria atlantica]CUH49844.1 hypothetical protein RUA4292_04044 [Ruegeria atlantica]
MSDSSQETQQQEAGEFPVEFDREFYRKTYSDLQSMNDEALEVHFYNHGIDEGRHASAPAVREEFVKLFQNEKSILEIGPFSNPIASGPNVRYFDVLDQDELKRRAEGLEEYYVPDNVPWIHYVSPTGDLSVVDGTYSAVVSAHCVEHQPDLINHFSKVSDLLADEGFYFLIVPDKRFCFDHFLCESSLAEILEAHHQRHRVHTLRSLVEHRTMLSHNDGARHWAGDHGTLLEPDIAALNASNAIAEYEAANGAYIDVHAWKFSPDSFRARTAELAAMDLINLRPIRVYQTVRPRLEFMAILQKTQS